MVLLVYDVLIASLTRRHESGESLGSPHRERSKPPGRMEMVNKHVLYFREHEIGNVHRKGMLASSFYDSLCEGVKQSNIHRTSKP